MAELWNISSDQHEENVQLKGSDRGLGLLRNHWRGIFGSLVPLLFIPLGISLKRSNLCFMTWAVVSFMSLVQPVPVQVIGSVPIFMFPLLGLLNSAATCSCYFNSVTGVWLTGTMLTFLWSQSKVDKRIACWLMNKFGPSHPMLLLSVCLASGFLSMVTMTTLVVAMMLPLVDELLKKLHTVGQEAPYKTVGSEIIANPVAAIYFVAVGSSAAIGSIGFLHASLASLTFLIQMDVQYPMLGEELCFMRFTLFTFPLMLVMLLLNYLYLLIMIKIDQHKISPASREVVKQYLKNQYASLGKITYHQLSSMTAMLTLVVALMARAPMGAPGWAKIISETPRYIRDSVVTALMAVSLHTTPADGEINKYLKYNSKSQLPPVAQRPSVLSWGQTNKNMPWGHLFTIGSTAVLVLGTKTSGLDEEFMAMLTKLEGLPYGLTLVFFVFLAVFLTNVMHYIAVLGFLMPVVFQMARALGICPVIPPLAVGLACSFTFALPFRGTPSSLLESVGHVDRSTLLKHGAASAVICAVVLCAGILIPAPFLWDCENAAKTWACGQMKIPEA